MSRACSAALRSPFPLLGTQAHAGRGLRVGTGITRNDVATAEPARNRIGQSLWRSSLDIRSRLDRPRSMCTGPDRRPDDAMVFRHYTGIRQP